MVRTVQKCRLQLLIVGQVLSRIMCPSFLPRKQPYAFLPFFIGDRDTEAEVWLRFWSWSFADFDQLVIWLKSGYFGESTQPLGLLCLWQRFLTCFDIHKIHLSKCNVSSEMLSKLDLQGLAVKKINFQLWQAVPPAANMFHTLVQQSQKRDTDWSNCFGRDFYTRKGRWTVKFKNNLHAISTRQSGPISNLHKIQTTSFNL